MTARLANLADFKCEGMREQMKVPSASAAQFTDRQPVTQLLYTVAEYHYYGTVQFSIY